MFLKVGWSPWLQTPLLSLSLFKFYLLIYYLTWLYWVFTAMQGLSLGAVSERSFLVGVCDFSLQ